MKEPAGKRRASFLSRIHLLVPIWCCLALASLLALSSCATTKGVTNDGATAEGSSTAAPEVESSAAVPETAPSSEVPVAQVQADEVALLPPENAAPTTAEGLIPPSADRMPGIQEDPESPFADAALGLVPPSIPSLPLSGLDEPSLTLPASPLAASAPEPVPEPASVAPSTLPTEPPQAQSSTVPSKEKPAVSAAPGKGEKVPSPAKMAPKAPIPVAPEAPSSSVVEKVAAPFPVVPSIPSPSIPTPEEPVIVPSRSVRVMVGQLLEVPFSGNGWIFLGESGGRSGLPYDSRRMDADGLSFVFRAEKVGDFILKFYRQDFIADLIFNDYVAVSVAEGPQDVSVGGFSAYRDRSRVVANPRLPLSGVQSEGTVGGAAGVKGPVDASAAKVGSSASVSTSSSAPTTTGPTDAASPSVASPVDVSPPAAAPSGTASGVAGTSASGSAATPTPSASTPSASTSARPTTVSNSSSSETKTAAFFDATPTPSQATGRQEAAKSPSELITSAWSALSAGSPSLVLQYLDQYRALLPGGSDEAWWLYGQALESPGSRRDVKGAIDWYRRLMREFPQSQRYEEARKRVAYLERYFLNIR